MRSLYIIGGGGFATEVLFVIERMSIIKKEWRNIYVIDDNIEKGKKVREYEIVGDVDYLLTLDDDIDVVVTINDTSIRKQIVNKILRNKKNVYFPNIIDTTSIIDEKYLQIGNGNIIMHFVVLSTNLILGDFNIFNSYTGVGHDTIMGDFNTFNPRVAISGNVVMKDLNNFGVNSTVLQNKKIGSDNQIWMNSSIVKNLKDGGKYFGVPAKKISL
ncbi:PglD-related sugar-binding protein [Flavobacterium xinjiangense]|jgi:sugar O-acyltransferase (sialic acid O-acetyltransferase NeuD family)|uniref:Sugar O-acyltransferase, sialic acid O-acetyltransferase NeuD family n=1 Tax=Flavobacterium xinjiangense TaxID=178356 RepID=A0A1M7MSW7_9FLAO|nr:serine acetyltransferase [Flavobacterium xinjiangense]SHM94114.1 sugar O-acyltransferase, sialic acid O-acetyltransferase NeuD family [Flavobacterium xinjiangense]